MIQDRTTNGMPIPFAEVANESNLLNLPGQMGNQVPLSPYSTGGFGAAQQASQIAGQVNPVEQAGIGSLIQGQAPVGMSPFTGAGVGTAGNIAQSSGMTGQEQQGLNTLGQFSGQGGFNSTSPAIQSALAGLQNQIVPAIQNQAAMSGLANSGELSRQVGQAYAQQLTPLYMQGLQQSQQAGIEQAQIGNTMAQRQMQGLQALRDAQMAAGQQQQALQTDAQMRALQGGQSLAGAGAGVAGRQLGALGQEAQAGLNLGQQQQGLGTEALSRQMYSTLSAAPQLQQIGLRQEQRPLDQIQQALQGGDLQRQLAQQQQQAVLDSYQRAREVSLGLLNPLGSFGASTSTPSQTTSSRTSPGGLGLSK